MTLPSHLATSRSKSPASQTPHMASADRSPERKIRTDLPNDSDIHSHPSVSHRPSSPASHESDRSTVQADGASSSSTLAPLRSTARSLFRDPRTLHPPGRSQSPASSFIHRSHSSDRAYRTASQSQPGSPQLHSASFRQNAADGVHLPPISSLSKEYSNDHQHYRRLSNASPYMGHAYQPHGQHRSQENGYEAKYFHSSMTGQRSSSSVDARNHLYHQEPAPSQYPSRSIQASQRDASRERHARYEHPSDKDSISSSPDASQFSQQRNSAASPPVTSLAGVQCSNCGVNSTPLWRRAPDGSTICNACGTYKSPFDFDLAAY